MIYMGAQGPYGIVIFTKAQYEHIRNLTSSSNPNDVIIVLILMILIRIL